MFFFFSLCQIISAPGPHTISSEFLVKRKVKLPVDTFTVSTDSISAGQTCWLRMLVRQLPASIIPVRAMILHGGLSWSLRRIPLKPIIFLQLLTYSQFVLREFGKDAISEPASMFPGQKSAKRQQTTDSNPSDAHEKAGGVEDEWGVHMERKHNAPLHRGVIDGIRQVINQMQQKGRMGVRGETRLPRDAGLPRERRVGNVSRCSSAHRGKRETSLS